MGNCRILVQTFQTYFQHIQYFSVKPTEERDVIEHRNGDPFWFINSFAGFGRILTDTHWLSFYFHRLDFPAAVDPSTKFSQRICRLKDGIGQPAKYSGFQSNQREYLHLAPEFLPGERYAINPPAVYGAVAVRQQKAGNHPPACQAHIFE